MKKKIKIAPNKINKERIIPGPKKKKGARNEPHATKDDSQKETICLTYEQSPVVIIKRYDRSQPSMCSLYF